jgi:hypothetical protein
MIGLRKEAISMKGYAKAIVTACVVAFAILLPAAQAGVPRGVGLLTGHESHCVGGPFGSGEDVTLTLSAGSSFWIDDMHFLVQEATITFTGNPVPLVYSSGVKTGLRDVTVTCSGDFPATDTSPGYHVVSHDVLVR